MFVAWKSSASNWKIRKSISARFTFRKEMTNFAAVRLNMAASIIHRADGIATVLTPLHVSARYVISKFERTVVFMKYFLLHKCELIPRAHKTDNVFSGNYPQLVITCI